MRNIISLVIFAFFMFFGSAHAEPQSLGRTVVATLKTGLNPGQKAAIVALDNFRTARNACTGLLSKNLSKNLDDILKEAPRWLVDVTRAIFADGQQIDEELAKKIHDHSFQINVDAHGPESQAAKKGLFEIPPIETQIKIKEIWTSRLDTNEKEDAFSIRIRTWDSDGQKRDLHFVNAPLRGQSVKTALGQLVRDIHGHWHTLSTVGSLQSEINMLRYQLMKLLRVGSPQRLPETINLFHILNKLDIKPAHFEDEKALGQAFLTYLGVKHDVIQMAQSVMKEHLRSETGQALPSIFYPFPFPVEVTNDHFTAWEWRMDPFHLLAQSWFRHTAETQVQSALMLFELLVDPNLYRGTKPLFLSSTMGNPSDFFTAINPGFLESAEKPIFEFQDLQVNRALRLIPEVDFEARRVTWKTINGEPAVFGEEEGL